MTLAPSPAYQARCSSGSASAQSPGGANPLDPPGPQLKSTQNARIASPAMRPGLPVHNKMSATHSAVPPGTGWLLDWRSFVRPVAALGSLETCWPAKVFNTAEADAWSRERLMPLDNKRAAVEQAPQCWR